MATAAQYIDEALRYGIPMEAIDDFLSRNFNSNTGEPDYSRIMTALSTDYAPGGAPRDTYVEGRGYVEPYRSAYISAPTEYPTRTYFRPEELDPQMIAEAPTNTPTDLPGVLPGDIAQTSQGAGWRDVVGGIVGMLPIPGAPVIGGIIRDFPLPGGNGGGGTPPFLQQPRLPMPGGGLPAPRPMPTPAPRPVGAGRTPGSIRATMSQSPYLNPRTGRNIPWKKIAKIAPLAAALGIGVEQYISSYGVPRDTPTMNPLNPRALRRAHARTERFVTFARRMVRFSEKCGLKSPRRRGRKKC